MRAKTPKAHPNVMAPRHRESELKLPPSVPGMTPHRRSIGRQIPCSHAVATTQSHRPSQPMRFLTGDHGRPRCSVGAPPSFEVGRPFESRTSLGTSKHITLASTKRHIDTIYRIVVVTIRALSQIGSRAWLFRDIVSHITSRHNQFGEHLTEALTPQSNPSSTLSQRLRARPRSEK